MKRSIGVTMAGLSFFVFSAVLLLLTYITITNAYPLLNAEDFLDLSLGFVYGIIAAWSLTTMVGVLRLRPWARIAALWLGVAAGLIYFLPLGRYIELVRTSRDVGWSWEAVVPLPAFLALAIWWLALFTRPSVKRQFALVSDER